MKPVGYIFLIGVLIFFGRIPLLLADSGPILFEIKGEKIVFIQDDRLRLLITQNCYTPNKKARCLALESLSKVSYRKIRSQLTGGKNPGIVICQKQTKGKVVVGIDSKKNQNSFCSFSDASIIDTGTLTHYGVKNDDASRNHKH
jgi:hypothetical protein